MKEDQIISKTAEDLSKGLAIGWFQGRMEFGPRALGGRSIIGDALLEAAIKGEGDSAKEFAEGVRLAIEIQREINNQSK